MSKSGYYEAVTTEIVGLLKKERQRRKLSNYVIWQRSGVSQSMLSQIERGLRRPSMEIVLRVADAAEADLPSIIQKAQAIVAKGSKLAVKGKG